MKQKIIEHQHPNDPETPDNVRFLVTFDQDKADEIVTYTEVLDHINREIERDLDPGEQLWRFKGIVGQEGLLRANMPSYKGSMYNVMVAWEDGTQTFEPLDVIAKDDPVTCAQYALEKGLLDLPGWKCFKSLTHRLNKFKRMINQANVSLFVEH